MFSLLRGLFVLLLCLVGIGLFRGWFSFSTPSRDAENNKVNVSVSVDANKVEADVEKVEEEVREMVAHRTTDDKSQDVTK
jgi:hypothetical protein